jgi:hypothetical protein|tara:strand:+ start:515 stop:1366 length:852 start_codon:yes stop_codon:yes gene_type:complete
MELATRYVDEKLPLHWDVDDSPESFQLLLNHICSATNFKTFFEKEIAHPDLFCPLPEGMIIADIGAGIGWTSALLALKPEVKKVYAVEPSKSRLSRIPYVAKHFGVPKDKIICVDGSFNNLKLPEKIHLACLSSSFHHCWDKDMPILLNNLKQALCRETIYKYKDYLDREKNMVYNSKILIASEHYVSFMWTVKKLIAYFVKGRFINNSDDPKNNFGNWREPDQFSSDHWRTKKEIQNFIQKAGYNMEIFLHEEDQCKDKKWDWLDRAIWKYYFAILEPMKNL